jgi:flagella basal body P-ring formation protein FlgA
MAAFFHIAICLAFISLSPEERAKNIVEQYIKSQFDQRPVDVAIEYRSFPSLSAYASEDYEFRVLRDGNSRFRGNMSFVLEVLRNGASTRTFVVSVRIRTFGTVLVARNQLDPTSVLCAASVAEKRIETTDLPPDYCSRPEILYGNRLRRLVNEGTVLRESMLEPLPVIQRGKRITLKLIAGHVVLTTDAVALEDGPCGSMIAISKLNSKDRFQAKVINEGTVEVRLN